MESSIRHVVVCLKFSYMIFLTQQQISLCMIGDRHLGLAKLQDYLDKNPFQPKKPSKYSWLTKHNGPGGLNIKGLDEWDEYELDLLELNNLMAQLRLKRVQDDDWTPQQKDFLNYVKECKDKERAKAIKAMMLGSAVRWGSFASKDFAKVGANHSKALFLAYERAKHVWEAVQMIPEVKCLWNDLRMMLGLQEIIPWVSKADWRLDDTKEVLLEEDEALEYLAPMQRNMAVQEGEKTEKEMVTKMNRIMMDTMAIAGMKMEGEDVFPEDVMAPLQQLMLVSDFNI